MQTISKYRLFYFFAGIFSLYIPMWLAHFGEASGSAFQQMLTSASGQWNLGFYVLALILIHASLGAPGKARSKPIIWFGLAFCYEISQGLGHSLPFSLYGADHLYADLDILCANIAAILGYLVLIPFSKQQMASPTSKGLSQLVKWIGIGLLGTSVANASARDSGETSSASEQKSSIEQQQ